jgi:hypothetical protein
MRGRLAVTPRRRDEEKASDTSDFRCHGVLWPRGDLAYEQIHKASKSRFVKRAASNAAWIFISKSTMFETNWHVPGWIETAHDPGGECRDVQPNCWPPDHLA